MENKKQRMSKVLDIIEKESDSQLITNESQDRTFYTLREITKLLDELRTVVDSHSKKLDELEKYIRSLAVQV